MHEQSSTPDSEAAPAWRCPGKEVTMRRYYKKILLPAAFMAAQLLASTVCADEGAGTKSENLDAGMDADAGPGDEADDSDESPAEETESAQFLHKPPAEIKPGEKITIRGQLTPRSEVDRMVLSYRRAGGKNFEKGRFKRDVRATAVAEIPLDIVESPGVEYYVYLVPAKKGGAPVRLFATEDDPYRVLVHGYSKKSRYESRKAEWDGRVSRVEANYGYSDFGTNRIDPETTAPGEYVNSDRGNYYHDVSVAYTYRFLTYLYALRVEIAGVAHDFADFKPFTGGKDKEIGPGMYAISPSVEFEFAKYFGASALFRLGISEEEFEGGAGMSLRVGRIKSTRLDVGFEGMSHAGWRLFVRFEWDTIPYVPMAFNLERTQWYAAPSYAAKEWGNRMYYEARINLPAGFGLRGHVGFASRDESVKGGFVAGGGIWLDF